MHVVAFTGHRPPRLGGYGSLNPVRAAVMKRLGAILSGAGVIPCEARGDVPQAPRGSKGDGSAGPVCRTRLHWSSRQAA